MGIRKTIVAAAGVGTLLAAVLAPREAAAQTIPPFAARDANWDAVSNVTTVVGASTVFLMPRVYYSDPEATVGWKGRWHVSSFAPAMTMTALTLFVDGPIRGAIKSNRPGCTTEQTKAALPDSGCESYGGPSTQAFASFGATGTGLGIFLVDTLKYSDGRFNVPSFLGNVAVPLTLSIVTSIGRTVQPGMAQAFESPGQVVAGALPGFFSGMLIGFTYAMLQKPSCGYGNSIICW
jgi:hypothetical protein